MSFLADIPMGGIVATGVAEQVRDRISSIVYLDAFVPEDGMSFSDFDPTWNHRGPLVPVPSFGPPPADEAGRKEAAKAMPQPTKNDDTKAEGDRILAKRSRRKPTLSARDGRGFSPQSHNGFVKTCLGKLKRS